MGPQLPKDAPQDGANGHRPIFTPTFTHRDAEELVSGLKDEARLLMMLAVRLAFPAIAEDSAWSAAIEGLRSSIKPSGHAEAQMFLKAAEIAKSLKARIGTEQ